MSPGQPGSNVSVLFVDPRGPYPSLVTDWWDEKRDARLYAGPNPVVAHPPCERWGRYWGGGPSAKVKRGLGDDGGCFFSALVMVRRFGGVLEHPEASHAFAAHGLTQPSWRRGWVSADDGLGWVCCVAQGNYGHRARKLTWLYYVGNNRPPELDWSIPPPSESRLDQGFHSRAERAAAANAPRSKRLSKLENVATPLPFARLLISLAQGSR